MTSAFADEVAAVRPRVTAVVARLVGDDAEDVVQEAVLRAFLSLSQLRDRDRFESWLCGIALNVAKMQLRRAATEARVLAAAGYRVTLDEREPLADVRDAVLLLRLLFGRKIEAVLAIELTDDEKTPVVEAYRVVATRSETRRRLARPAAEVPVFRLDLS